MRLVKSTCPRAQILLLRNPSRTRHSEFFGKVYHDPIHHGFKAVSQRAPTFRSWGALSVRCFRNRLIRSIIDWYLKGIAWKTFKCLEQVLGYESRPMCYEPLPAQIHSSKELESGKYLNEQAKRENANQKHRCHRQKEQAGAHQQKKNPVNQRARKHGTSRKRDLSNISRKDVQYWRGCCPLCHP